MAPLFDAVTLLVATKLTRQIETGKYVDFKDLRGGNLATPLHLVGDAMINRKIGVARPYPVCHHVAAICAATGFSWRTPALYTGSNPTRRGIDL